MGNNRENSLPIGWRWAKMGDIIAEAQPGFATGQRNPQGVIQLRMNNVDTRGNLLWDEFIRVPADSAKVEKFGLKIGDVVFNNTNSTELVGKSAQFTGHDEPVTYSNHFTRLRTKPDIADSGFVTFWLISQWQAKTFENICNRWIGQSAVKTDKLFVLEIPLPPLDEQRRIASRLNEQFAAVEFARKAAKEQLQAARQLEETYLANLFGSKLAHSWQRKNIGSVTKIQTGYAFKSIWFTSEGIRLLRNANVFQGYIDWTDIVKLPMERRREFKAFEMNPGDIVLSLDRPLVSNGLKVARLTEDDVPSLLLQRVARFQLTDEISPNYLYSFLRSQFFIDEITGHAHSIGVPHISPKQIGAIELPLPDLNTQIKFAREIQEKISYANQLCESLESQLAEIESLSASLLREAFADSLSS